jgi:hypothetical protein
MRPSFRAGHVAEPSAVGRLTAVSPSWALIRSYELLMRQVRNAVTDKTPLVLQETPQMNRAADETGPNAPHTDPTNGSVGSYDLHTAATDPPIAPYTAQKDSSEALIRITDEAGRSRAGGSLTSKASGVGVAT